MDINARLKKLRNEDIIWIIYFFISAFAILSNHLDRVFIETKDINAYHKEKGINITIFIIAFFIYLYFVLSITKDLGHMEQNFNDEKYRHTFLQLIAALLFLIGGIIYLYLEITTNDTADIGILS